MNPSHLIALAGLADASAWAVYFVGAGMAVIGAFGVVLMRNPVYCALGLVTTIFGIAMLFIDEGADFLAAVQVIVYAGAIVILFLFVIMLLGVDRPEPEPRGSKLHGMLPAALAVGIVAVAELLVLTRVHYWATGSLSSTQAASGPGENVQKLGESIFTVYLLPFEMTAALLVIAVVAAVTLVRRTNADTNPNRRPEGGRAPTGQPAPGFSHAGMVPSVSAQSGPGAVAGSAGPGPATTEGPRP